VDRYCFGNTIEVQGHGTIQWTVIDDDGKPHQIQTIGLYVPAMKFRLFSPQAYVKEQNSNCDGFSLNKDTASLSLNGSKSKCTIKYDATTALLVFGSYQDLIQSAEMVAANLTINMDTLNHNLSPGQKDQVASLSWSPWLSVD
jgi:hypothetical protein